MKFPNPFGPLVDLVVKNVAQKFLSSFLKALAALALALLAAMLKIDPLSILASQNIDVSPTLVLPVWSVFVSILNGAVSAVKRWATFDLAKLPDVK